MTASTLSIRTGIGRLPGFRALFRKELMEWRRGRRWWIALLIATGFMALTALNAWLQATFLPADGSAGIPDPITDPFTNVVVAVSGQIFVIVAVFTVMGLLVGERESGTLAWTASKPVSRSAIWLAKLSASTAVLWVVAALVPLAVTVVVVTVLYGSVPLAPMLVIVIGMAMAIAFYVAVALAAATVVSSQAAVAGIAIGVMFVPQLLGLLIPDPAVLPTAILPWSLQVAAGESAGWVTPLSWAVSMVALVILGLRRMERLEL